MGPISRHLVLITVFCVTAHYHPAFERPTVDDVKFTDAARLTVDRAFSVCFRNILLAEL